MLAFGTAVLAHVTGFHLPQSNLTTSADTKVVEGFTFLWQPVLQSVYTDSETEAFVLTHFTILVTM